MSDINPIHRKFNWNASASPKHYDSLENVMLRHRLLTILKSKTFWGGVAGAAGVLLNAAEITPAILAQAGGILLGAAGLRDSITKLSLPK